MTYSPSTVKRARTILRNVDARKVAVAQNRVTSKATKSTRPDWRLRPASDSQIARIHRCERDLGYKLSTRATIGNAGAASDLYQSLKAEIRAL